MFEGCDLALTFYPGAAEAYDRAIASRPGFCLGPRRQSPGPDEGRRCRGGAGGPGGSQGDRPLACPKREASHIGFFDLVFAGRTDAAIAALYAHLTAWPRDALVVASAANPNGLIGGSGRIGQKHQIAALMDSLAPHYGDDFWFLVLSCHGAVRGWAARGGAGEDRAIAGHEPEQCAWCARLRPCLLREWRAGHGPHLPVLVARHLSARGLFLWPSELASLALRNPGRQLDRSIAAVSGRHRARPAQRRAATENVGWGGVFVALRTRRPSARRRGLAATVRLREQRIAAAGQRARRSARHPGTGRHGR